MYYVDDVIRIIIWSQAIIGQSVQNVLPELSSVYMLQWHDNDDSQSSCMTSIINRIYTE